MISWFIHRIQRQQKLGGKIQLSFKLVLLSVAGALVCVLTVGTVMLGELVSEGYEAYWMEQATKNAMGQVENMVKDMANRIDAMVPQGTVIGPGMDPKVQERVKDLIRETMNGPNGYYFMFDHEGRVIAQRIQREHEGTTRREAVDKDGKLYVQKLIEAAKQGGGFVEYRMVKPNQEGIHPKLSYAKMLRGDQWWVGSGFYLDDIETNVRAMKKEMWFKIWTITALIIVFVCGLVLGALRLSQILTQQITEPIAQLVDGANKLAAGEYESRVMVDTHDELERLADTFNDMGKTIGRTISDLQTAQEESKSLLEQNRAFSEKERTLLEKERERIAQDLHDDICSKLLTLRTDCESSQRAVKDEGQRAAWAKMSQSIVEINDEVRNSVKKLYPRSLNELGLSAALRGQLEKQAAAAGIALGFHNQGGELRVLHDVGIKVFRVFQEAMTNVVKHARAHRVDVWIRYNADRLEVSMEDDGQGFDVAAKMQQKVGHYGLQIIEERVRSLGGTVQFVSKPRINGTRVEVSIPLINS